jgi:hypothetical protein
MKFKKLRFLLPLYFVIQIPVVAIGQADYFTIDNLCAFSTPEYSKINACKEQANQKAYFSDELQGTYKDDYGNEITFGKESTVYKIKISATVKKLFEDELKEISFYWGVSGDKKDLYYTTLNGRFEIILKKNLNYWSFIVNEYKKGKPNIAHMLYSTAGNKFEVNSYTTFAEVFVKKGDKLYLKAEGAISFGTWAGSCSPNGIDGFESYSVRSTFKHGALLGKIGKEGIWFLIGSYKVITAETDDNLYLMINDYDPSNNNGLFEVEYSINKEIPPPVNNPIAIEKPSVINTPQPILEDFFVDNKNNWAVASDKHIISIEGNRMIYENKEKNDKIYTMVGIPISLKGNDNYIVEISIQSLTPCINQQIDNLVSLVSKKPKPNFLALQLATRKTTFSLL